MSFQIKVEKESIMWTLTSIILRLPRKQNTHCVYMTTIVFPNDNFVPFVLVIYFSISFVNILLKKKISLYTYILKKTCLYIYNNSTWCCGILCIILTKCSPFVNDRFFSRMLQLDCTLLLPSFILQLFISSSILPFITIGGFLASAVCLSMHRKVKASVWFISSCCGVLSTFSATLWTFCVIQALKIIIDNFTLPAHRTYTLYFHKG